MTHQFSRELQTLVRGKFQRVATKLVNSLENFKVIKEHTGCLSNINGRFKVSRHAVYACENDKNLRELGQAHDFQSKSWILSNIFNLYDEDLGGLGGDAVAVIGALANKPEDVAISSGHHQLTALF